VTVYSLAVVGLVTLVRPLLFDVTPLASGSMSPTLQGDERGGDLVLAEKVSYWFREPRRWDVVEFKDSNGIQIMKRVMGMPGEYLAVKDRHVEVNGQALVTPKGVAAVRYYPYGNLIGGKAYEVKGGYYVLGDDSADSEDSRYEGPVERKQIRARAWLIVWPPSRMGWVR
jgi:signal peptidase I